MLHKTLPKILVITGLAFLIGCSSVPGENIPKTEPPSQLLITETTFPDGRKESTPSPTITPEYTSTITQTPAARLAPGTIYVIRGLEYGYLLPVDELQEITPVLPQKRDVPDAFFSEAMNFSNYSEEIAYLIKGEPVTLWVADLSFTRAQKIWADNQDWLQYDRRNGDEIDITWGPGDSSVILSNREKNVVVSLKDGMAFPFAGWCDGLATLPNPKRFALVCGDPGEPNLRVLLEGDGTVLRASEPQPENLKKIQTIAFSKDKARVIYAGEDGGLFVEDLEGKRMRLPVDYVKPFRSNAFVRRLQWSRDGSKLLILGIEQASQRSSWFVLSAEDGKVLWSIDDSIGIHGDASLSPDNNWIVLFTLGVYGNDPYTLILSLQDQRSYQISFWACETARWTDE